MGWLNVSLAGSAPQSEAIGSNPGRQLVLVKSICGWTISSGGSMVGESRASGPSNPMQPSALEQKNPEARTRHSGLGRDFLKVDAIIWADLSTGHVGISMVDEHSKNELKIGSDQARGINLVSGMAPSREARCPNHKLGSDMDRCQCSNLPAGTQFLPLLSGRS